VIKHCLIELNKFLEIIPDIQEIIQNVIFIGAACKLETEKYKLDEFFRLISGRIVNCFSPYDFTLADNYSYKALGVTALNQAGQSIENYDLSEFKLYHNDYQENIGKILKNINIL